MRPLSRLPLVVAACALALVAVACGGKDKPSVPAGSVALVDTHPITKTDFDHLVGIGLASYKAQGQTVPKVGTADYAKLRQQALLVLVQRLAIQQEARKDGLKAKPADIQKKLDDVKKQTPGGAAKWPAYLKTTGATEQDYRTVFELQILGQELYDRVTKSVAVTDADIQKYYAANQSTFKQAESRRVQHILIGGSGTKTPTKAEYAKYLATATSVLAQVKAGANFTALVKKYSTDPGKTSNNGFYDVTPTGFDATFTKASYALKTGQVTAAPVKSAFGYHIIKAITALKPGTVQPLAKVQAQIKTQLEQGKKDKASSAWFETLLESYESKTTFAVGYSLPPKTTASTATATSSAGTSTG